MLEQKELIENDILDQVAKILKVPVQAIENFDEDSVINIVTNTFSDFKDNAVASPVAMNYNCTFNPLDKMVELYERMLEQQKEMIEKLEKLINKE